MNIKCISFVLLASVSLGQFIPIPTPPVDPSGGGSSKDVKDLKEAFNTLTNSLDEVAYTGDYNDLTNTPVNISYFTNDANYVTINYVSNNYLSITGGTLTGGLSINSGSTSDSNSLSVGTRNIVSGNGAVVFGNSSIATSSSFSHGYLTESTANNSHAEGQGSIAKGARSHSEGYYTIASGPGSHSIGNNTESRGSYSFASGYNSLASNQYSWVWSGILPTTIYNEDDLDYNVYSNDIKRLSINPYTSHGPGTFNINPISGADGFYIGNIALSDIIDTKLKSAILNGIEINGTNYVLVISEVQ